jgi:hypothetical protein
MQGKIDPPITDWSDKRLKPHWSMDPGFLIGVIVLLLFILFGFILGPIVYRNY